MFLKLMGAEQAPDHDSRKRFTLLAKVSAVEFTRIFREIGPDGESITTAAARVTFESGEMETHHIEGNAYVLSDSGKTIANFGYAPIPQLQTIGPNRSLDPGLPAVA